MICEREDLGRVLNISLSITEQIKYDESILTKKQYLNLFHSYKI